MKTDDKTASAKKGEEAAVGHSSSGSGGVPLSPGLTFFPEEDGRQAAVARKTGERRPAVPGFIAPLGPDDRKKQVWTCFRCGVELDEKWKLLRHKKTHGEPEKTAPPETNTRRVKESKRGGERTDVGRGGEKKKSSPTAEGSPHESSVSKSSGSQSLDETRGGGAIRKKNFHECPHCEYRTAISGHLKRHVDALHSGHKPHLCPHCPHRAARSDSLKQHVAAVHLCERPHRCPRCDYRSAKSHDLQRHVAAVHGGERPHRCPRCEYGTADVSVLKRHVAAVHLNRRPFQCPQCDYRATRSSDLKRHVRALHEQQRPKPEDASPARNSKGDEP